MADYQQTPLWLSTLAPQRTDDETTNEARERLRHAYEQFRKKAEILVNEIHAVLPDYTVHDITHSDALWDIASLIAGPNIILTPPEAFVLGGAFLIHDAGMGLAAYPEGIDELRKQPIWRDTLATILKEEEGRLPNPDELLRPDENIEKKAIACLLRDLHAERAEKLVMLPWKDLGQTREYYLIEDTDLHQMYGELIGKLAYSHWWPISQIEKELDFPVNAPYWCPRDWIIDPLLLACLLRVADICHIDASRATGFLRALRKPAPSSKEHWIFQEHLQQPQLDGDRLRYTSGQPFRFKDAQAWWLCFDTLRDIDHELRMVDGLLADYRHRRLAGRGVRGIEEPTRLAKYIRTEDWLPVDAHIQVSDLTHLIQELGGEALYGKDLTVPLREMIQNAADAIRARRIEEERSIDWGDVHIRLGKDREGEWLEVEDNGIGMSVAVLTGTLLDFGKSYWGSMLMRSEFPSLISKGFQSTGKYGIGFFSVFMLGEHVQVVSRRFDASYQDTHVLEFNNGIVSRPILRKASKQEYIREGGTRVRVWFKRSFENQEDLLQSLTIKKSGGTLKDLCRFLCPSIDVNLYTKEMNRTPELVISAGDWITIDGRELLERMCKPTQDIDESNIKTQIGMFSSHLRLITNSSGEIIGRACIIMRDFVEIGNKKHQFIESKGVVTVGGLRTTSLIFIFGVFTGVAMRAARDMAIPYVENPILARWATEQAELLSNLSIDAEELAEMASAVRVFGGDTGKLPIAFGAHGWMSVREISEWLDVSDEVLIVQDAAVYLIRRELKKLVLHPNVLAVEVGSPGILSRNYYDSPWIDWPNIPANEWSGSDREFKRTTLAGAVIEALVNAWSSSLKDVLHVSQFSSDERAVNREIGLGDGKPILRSVYVIRNPKKYQ
jgi:hypothetical protein